MGRRKKDEDGELEADTQGVKGDYRPVPYARKPPFPFLSAKNCSFHPAPEAPEGDSYATGGRHGSSRGLSCFSPSFFSVSPVLSRPSQGYRSGVGEGKGPLSPCFHLIAIEDQGSLRVKERRKMPVDYLQKYKGMRKGLGR